MQKSNISPVTTWQADARDSWWSGVLPSSDQKNVLIRLSAWWRQEGLAWWTLRKCSFKLPLKSWIFCTTCTLFSLVGHYVPSSSVLEWALHYVLQQHAEKPPLTSSCWLFSISLSSLLPSIRWQMLICGFHNVCCTATRMIMMLVDLLLFLFSWHSEQNFAFEPDKNIQKKISNLCHSWKWNLLCLCTCETLIKHSHHPLKAINFSRYKHQFWPFWYLLQTQHGLWRPSINC